MAAGQRERFAFRTRASPAPELVPHRADVGELRAEGPGEVVPRSVPGGDVTENRKTHGGQRQDESELRHGKLGVAQAATMKWTHPWYWSRNLFALAGHTHMDCKVGYVWLVGEKDNSFNAMRGSEVEM